MSNPIITPLEKSHILDLAKTGSVDEFELEIARISFRNQTTFIATLSTIRDEHGLTFLHKASQDGQLAILAWFFQCPELQLYPGAKYALLQARSHNGNNALMWAAHYGHTDMLTELNRRGCDLIARNNFNMNAIHLASEYNHTETTRQLFALFLSAGHGSRLHQPKPNGNNPLHLAARNGNLDLARFLLQNFGNPHAGSATGITPLHLAASNDCREMVVALLGYGADMLSSDMMGRTPVGIAVARGVSPSE